MKSPIIFNVYLYHDDTPNFVTVWRPYRATRPDRWPARLRGLSRKETLELVQRLDHQFGKASVNILHDLTLCFSWEVSKREKELENVQICA